MAAVDISVLVQGLSAQIDVLASELFPNGRRYGNEFKVGSLAGEPGQSMSIKISGSKAGVWKDFADGRGGDALDLVAHTLFGGDKSEAVKWAKGRLGYSDDADPTVLEKQRQRAKRAAEKKKSDAKKDDQRRMKYAGSIFFGAEENILDTPVEHYLLGRGIDLRCLPRLPGSIRFHPNLIHPEGGEHPAMVASIFGRDGKARAIHRTWLKVHDGGPVSKIDRDLQKAWLGPARGGSIRLWRGTSGKPLGAHDVAEPVVITEGIEDGLTVALAGVHTGHDYRVLVALSISNMLAVDLPASVREVIIAADNDSPGSAARGGLMNAVRRFQQQGRSVRIARAPGGAKDFNDVLRGAGTA